MFEIILLIVFVYFFFTTRVNSNFCIFVLLISLKLKMCVSLLSPLVVVFFMFIMFIISREFTAWPTGVAVQRSVKVETVEKKKRMTRRRKKKKN